MKQLPLREDVRLLGDLLGLTIKEQAGEDIFATIEQIRKLSKSEDIENLSMLLHSLPIKEFVPITKAFSQFLNFANIAEQYHRIRRARSYKFDDEQGPQLGSLEDAIPKLKAKVDAETLYNAIRNLEIQLVLTSHPTEVKRRTVMRKYERISNALQKLDCQILTHDDICEIKNDLHSEMTAVWQTPEVRSHKPTAVDEAKWGFAIIEGSLWHAVPMFMREFDRVIKSELGKDLPLDFMPVKIDSWLGGDRDGNPNVTPEVTRRVTFMARWVAADLILIEIKKLRDSLSMQHCNTRLRSLVGEESTEPYRDILKQVQKKLKNTKYWARENFVQYTEISEPIFYYTAEILEPLLVCYQSLCECKAKIVADGRLLDLIRQVECFGASLVRMDIRQEASKHAELMSAITQNMGLGDYALWSETERQGFLIGSLEQELPLDTEKLEENPNLMATIQTFKLLSELPREGLGAYVISMSSQPSDVLAVVLLQREFGLKRLLPVVPLFETYSDLLNSATILDTLLRLDVYRNLIAGYQQIMIGYSDSAKDVGTLAAAWSQYCAQEAMLKVAHHYSIKLVFFHGRGGSLGRGGWPTHEAILSQPPGSVHGVMRVTQQGEVIQNRFGLRGIALRTLAVYSTSTLEASLLPPMAPKDEWRTLLNDLSRVSSANYKQIVAQDPRFLAYFQTATPTRELKRLAIGSRPDSRANTDSLSKLRAIPWIFAWTQNRLLLPSWAGVGVALQHAFETDRGQDVVAMAQQWPFFHTILSMCEMVLAKADINVALHYEQRLVTGELKILGKELREQFIDTKDIILRVLGQDQLLQGNPGLDRSIKLRNPYLLPLHLLQVELLDRVRAMAREDEANAQGDVIPALLISIAGIAAGMRNTG
jgi:phosphoenolpyruvate carboxylase